MAAGRVSRWERKAVERDRILRREQLRSRRKQISWILKKTVEERSQEECLMLSESADLVKELEWRNQRCESLRRRQEEVFDEPETLRKKVWELASAVQSAKHLVVYTGAGISTAASIPDYRGPNGVWTLLHKGKSTCTSDLSDAEPTLTHMAIAQLHACKLVQHVVSQNCDGLHLRSGLSRAAISELHGNMYIEVCTSCSPNREYIRLFDVTERTGLHRHLTGRKCCHCAGDLRDTIVHFGERGILAQPLNWAAAVEAAEKADMILCLGSSLKVLKKYHCLWCMNKPRSRRPKLYIVNLQWTPKDDMAVLKIHGKCDDVLRLLIGELGLEIPAYNRSKDPIFSLAVPLQSGEEASHNRRAVRTAEEVDRSQNGAHQEEDVRGLEACQISAVPPSVGWFGKGCRKHTKRKK